MDFTAALFGCAFLGAIGLTNSASAQTEPAAIEEKAIFAGGCFWCIQPYFDKAPGVLGTFVGYAGGREEHPTYKQVSAGETGHREALEVTYDPAKISYEKLLEIFWQNINPVQTDGQFFDVGDQYTTAIFYTSEAQKLSAEASKDALGKSGKFQKPIATAILPATTFWPAEEYHQKYYEKNRMAYGIYHFTSGRGSYKKRIWGSGK